METVSISQLSTPPARYPTQITALELATFQAAILAAGCKAHLYKNNFEATNSTVLSDLTECDNPFYAPIVVSSFYGPFIDQNGNSYMNTPECVFSAGAGADNLIYGAYLTYQTGAAATATFTLTGGQYTLPVITAPGSGYEVAPRVNVTGATGTGAKLSAVITGGEVTAINIDDPGTGYTTAVATIEPPETLLYVGTFAAPKPLILPTDGIPVVFEMTNLAAV